MMQKVDHNRSRWSLCRCGKRGFHSRRDAKAARRSLSDHGLSIYRCEVDPLFLHLGHLYGQDREEARRKSRDRAERDFGGT